MTIRKDLEKRSTLTKERKCAEAETVLSGQGQYHQKSSIFTLCGTSVLDQQESGQEIFLSILSRWLLGSKVELQVKL